MKKICKPWAFYISAEQKEPPALLLLGGKHEALHVQNIYINHHLVRSSVPLLLKG
jgi:hypothetical protein